MRFKIVFGWMCACACAFAQGSQALHQPAQDIIKTEYQHHKLFWSSVAVFGAASAFDYATSVALNDAAKKGLVHEKNEFLRTSYGGFDPVKGAAYKLGSRASTVAVELWIRHRYANSAESSKKLDRYFSVVNFGVSSLFWKVGAGNIRIGQRVGAF
ncbi:MAG: hypothetical protein M3Z32_10055 [Acidobacteriota bacterium]|nr:hypothetical protein [Acidobacteriota bacterium]